MSQLTARPGKPTASNRFPVHCDEHGERYGFVVCLCVVHGFDAVKIVVHPTPKKLGTITCKRTNHEKREFVLLCGQCAKEKGLDQVGGRLQ